MTIALAAVNRAPTLWGADAGVFRPERWLEEEVGEERAKEVQGHRHLLTFSDGTRAYVARARRLECGIGVLMVCGFSCRCLGKQFALAELKVRALLCACGGWLTSGGRGRRRCSVCSSGIMRSSIATGLRRRSDGIGRFSSARRWRARMARGCRWWFGGWSSAGRVQSRNEHVRLALSLCYSFALLEKVV